MKPKLRLSLTPFILSVCGILASCGGEGKGSSVDSNVSDSLESFRKQTVAWQQCDSTILGNQVRDEEFDSVVSMLGRRVSCATIRVPLDYARPHGDEATVAVLRVSARKPAERVGAILINPGGPGNDGLGYGLNLAVRLAQYWQHPSSNNEERELTSKLIDHYDLIGFSPRGVGASSRLYCGSNEIWKNEKDVVADSSASNISNVQFNARILAEACAKNPLTKYINTEQTARDMDLIRSLLGDEKLNYIGFSYGTWLGSWYAALFPKHTGKMVLDSSMDFTASTFDEASLAQAPARQRIFDAVLSPYASRHPGIFNFGIDPGALSATYRSLPPELKSVVRTKFNYSRTFYTSFNAPASVATIMAAQGIKTLMEQHPDADRARLGKLIAGYLFTAEENPDNGSRFNRDVRDIANELADAYFDQEQAAETTVELHPQSAVFSAVVCNDAPTGSKDPAFWVALGHKHLATYPVGVSSKTFTGNCTYWGQPTTAKPPMANIAQSFSPLIVQSEFDGATATELAMKAFDAMPKASLVFVKNEYEHGLFPYGSACVDNTVLRYLVDGAQSGRRLECVGKPLAYDTELAYDTQQPNDRTMALTPRSMTNGAAGEAQVERERILQKIRDLKQRNAIQF